MVNLNIQISFYRDFKNEMTYKPYKYIYLHDLQIYLMKKQLDWKLTNEPVIYFDVQVIYICTTICVKIVNGVSS